MSYKRHKAFQQVVIYTVLIAVSVVMGAPFLWMVLSSLKPNHELFAYPPVWIPSTLTFEHYINAFRYTDFSRYFLNSFIVTGVTVISNLFFCSLAGYAFARMDFYGKNVIFMALLGTMMIPIHVRLVPLFISVRRFPLAGGNNLFGQGGTGLIDTHLGLMLPHLINIFGVFLMRQFFQSIPQELTDAAKIDGAGEFGTYWRIFLPLSKPALATLSIFVFSSSWDDFLWPLVVTSSRYMRTVQLGLQIFQSQFTVNWGSLMAATLVVTLPVITIFIFGQKYFVQGIATTGLKG
ncbi:MAG TPA: carbohydrate ABC transporter permease [Firmicutes bacterium]|jgi:multiple sugar transport system permease protein|nr:carbohydrate ABC transporter permease [Bacillota bacterium]